MMVWVKIYTQNCFAQLIRVEALILFRSGWWVGGQVRGEKKMKTTSAKVEVEVEAELGNQNQKQKIKIKN